MIIFNLFMLSLCILIKANEEVLEIVKETELNKLFEEEKFVITLLSKNFFSFLLIQNYYSCLSNFL